jgi:hypothetical protein
VLALALAQRRPKAALIFCNSLDVTPRSRALRWFPHLRQSIDDDVAIVCHRADP